jgi:nicotinamidase-related amidase
MDKETLLMVIDVQKDLFNKTKKVFNEQKIIENINTIINVFREKDLPIIFIKHTNDGSMKENSDGWQFHPNLKVNDNDLVLMKRVSSSLREKAIIKK